MQHSAPQHILFVGQHVLLGAGGIAEQHIDVILHAHNPPHPLGTLHALGPQDVVQQTPELEQVWFMDPQQTPLQHALAQQPPPQGTSGGMHVTFTGGGVGTGGGLEVEVWNEFETICGPQSH